MFKLNRRCLLLVLLLLLALLWFAPRTDPLTTSIAAPFVGAHSLTVVLPVLPSTLGTLHDLIIPFLVPASTVHEVAIVCPQSIAADVRRLLNHLVRNVSHGYPKMSVHPWSSPTQHHPKASLDLVARLTTPWVLLLDEHGLRDTAECDRAYLVRPRAVRLPVGPRGFIGTSELSPSSRAQSAAFLVPPFVAPSDLLARAPLASPVWPALGNYIAKSTSVPFGGIVIGPDILDATICLTRTDTVPHTSNTGFFVLALPREEDLRNLIPATCRLLRQGYTLLAYLYDTIDEVGLPGIISEENCAILYFGRSTRFPNFSDWLDSLGLAPDLLIGLDLQDPITSMFSLILQQPRLLNTTLMRLPRSELPYSEWIGTLTLQELRNWNVPEITLTVITNNRPHSLRRLLESIQRTLFYGDKVDVRINMDQTSDLETMNIVRDFEWIHGDVSLHHRVIHGGLLAAVVESWYPRCNDSYGLLLEDDVELSPLAYAWAKMTLLRYKYGKYSFFSSQLFGISLYQQNVIELRPTGRQSFSARTLFRSASLADPSTPYLSQIPCSWGALYFPSHWREFHDYVSLRLAADHQPSLLPPVSHTIVPGVRSNMWTRSWKKYFIELVYLRGYVMLYPNYDNFASLSTNHLEVGSHVKDEPEEVYERKKRLFSLPLMSLASALPSASLSGELALVSVSVSPSRIDGETEHGPRLLDLPRGTLPEWDLLPVLDLLGELSSMEEIQKRGDERRSELDACALGMGSASELPSDVRDLFCQYPV